MIENIEQPVNSDYPILTSSLISIVLLANIAYPVVKLHRIRKTKP